jgi:hypothetical protein
MREEVRKEVDDLIKLHYEFKKLLDAKDFTNVETKMVNLISEANVGRLKTCLIITKSFKENPIIKNTRIKCVDKLETLLGTKLV